MSSRHPHLLPGGLPTWDDEAPQCVVEAMREMRRRAHDDDIVRRLPLQAPLLTPSPVLAPPAEGFAPVDETPFAWESEETPTAERAARAESEPIALEVDLSPRRSRWVGSLVVLLVIAGAGAAGAAIARTGVTALGTAGADDGGGTVHTARYAVGPATIDVPDEVRLQPASTVEAGEPVIEKLDVASDVASEEARNHAERTRHRKAAVKRPRVAQPAPKSIAREPGYLTIDATPYATIYIDGDEVGDTPLVRVGLAAGTHRVRAVSSAGTEVFIIDVASGATVRRRISFEGR